MPAPTMSPMIPTTSATALGGIEHEAQSYPHHEQADAAEDPGEPFVFLRFAFEHFVGGVIAVVEELDGVVFRLIRREG